MTVYQSNSNAIVAFKVQSGLGSAATGSGATVLRTAGGSGLKMTKAATESNEVRRDGMSQRGRHGTQKVAFDYSAELSLGSHDSIVEAICRDTFTSADLTLTQSDFTSLTTTASTIVLTSGSPITLGLRVGDVIEMTGFSTAANNSKNLRVTGLSATTITVAETLVLNAVADTTCSLIRRGKKVTPYASSGLTKRYYTIEQYEADIDQSTTSQDCVFGGIKFSMSPNGLLMADVTGAGTGQISALATGSSPYFSSPTQSTATPFSVVDATIRLNGTDLVELTSLDLSMDIQPNAPDVFGSGGIKYAPDVFTGQMAISMNLGMLRKDLAIFSDFIAETAYTLHILAVENEAEPKDFFSIYVPNFTLGSVDPSALSKQGGGRTQTISIPQALVGIDNTGSGYDASMIKFQSTAP